GPVTVSCAVPLLPSLVAVMVTGPPADTPVTTPPAETVATLAAPLVQVTARPLSAAPAASRTVTVSAWVPATVTVAVVGVTATEATAAGGGGGGGAGGGGGVTGVPPPPQEARRAA